MSASKGSKDVLIEGNRYFVPWALKALSGARAGRRNAGIDLPVGKATSLTAEARDRIADALPTAAVRFVVAEGGWRGLLLPTASGRIVEGARISHPNVWDDFQLEFSRHSIDALIRTYNEASYSRDIAPAGAEWLTGDAIILHLLQIQRWRQAPERTHLVNYPFHPPSPLSTAASFMQSRTSFRALTIAWDLLEPVLPWLSFHLGQHWAAHVIEIVCRVHDNLRGRCESLRDVFQTWQQQVLERGRPDLARPMVLAARTLADWLDDGPGLMVRMAALFERTARPTQYLRQMARDDVAKPFKALLGARDVYEQCVRSLPFERDAAQRVFVRDCDRYGASEAWQRLEACVADLEGVIG